MSKSVLYASTPSGTSVQANGTVPITTINRRYGCNCQLNNGKVSTTGIGYFKETIVVSGVATTSGIETVSLLQDGEIITTSSATISASGDTFSIPVVAVTRNYRSCEPSVISIVSSGAITTSNVSVVVEKM